VGLSIYLLGTCSVEIDGIRRPPPRGRKAWAVLAYLLASRHPVSREHLAELLFGDANDPLGALRWSLSQLRRLFGVANVLTGAQRSLVLPPATYVDVHALRVGTWREAVAVPGIGRDLLEGMNFPSSPAFESWLLLERRSLQGTAEAAFREAALANLAAGKYHAAIGFGVRLVALNGCASTTRCVYRSVPS